MKRLLMVTLLVLAAAPAAFAQCSEADKQKLVAWDKAMGDASVAGDRAFLQSAYADDYVGMMPWGRLDKTTSVANAVSSAERNKANPQAAPKSAYDYYEITCTPNSAVVAHRTVTTQLVGGKQETTYARSVHVLEKRGGNWLLISNAGSPLDDAGQLLYMEREWNDADIKHDVAWFERNYADDYTGVSSRTGVLTNKAQDVADAKNSKMVTESAELSNMNVRMERDIAVVMGVNHVKGRDDKGVAFDRHVRFTDIFVKRDGRWQVLTTQGTVVQ